MLSNIQTFGNFLWQALPQMGPLFDDSWTPIFPFEKLTPELACHVFTFLPFKDLVSASKVSKIWRTIANSKEALNAINLKEIPGVTVGDKAVLAERFDLAALGIDFIGLPDIDNRAIIKVLKKLLARGVIENDAGAAVLMWPNGLDIDKLITMAQNPIKGHRTHLEIPPELIGRLREIPVSRACILVMSNSVLNGSRNKPAQVQRKQVYDIGCVEPEALPLAMLAILTYCCSGIRLYGKDTTARCSEEMQIYRYNEFVKLVVGDFGLFAAPSDGLWITTYIPSDEVTNSTGTAAFWKWKGRQKERKKNDVLPNSFVL